jgi:UDP:flavonoid glycosyltransferase YjiC (YdhE family)
VRILFSTLPSAGHFHPLVALARAARQAGHDVAFATAVSFCPTVEAVGFRAFPAGFDRHGAALDELFPPMRTLTGIEFTRFVNGHIRISVEAAQMVPDLLALAAIWPPDLIVRDAAEYGGCVAAEMLGVPHASVRTAVTPSSYAGRHLVAAELAALRGVYGLPSDPELEMPFRYLHLACEPPGLWPADDPPAPTSHLVRPEPFDRPGGEALPDWVADLGTEPTVCATLGTFMNRSADVFRAVLDGLRGEGLNVVVTVGRDQDPAQFGPQPEHVHIERYIPLSLLLPSCALVVCQSGFSTVVTALGQGLPLVLIPLGADQPLVAQQVARLGVGPVLGPAERTPAAIQAAVRAVLGEPSYRSNAEGVRDQMASLPGVEHAVALLNQLANERQPLPNSPDRQQHELRPPPPPALRGS